MDLITQFEKEVEDTLKPVKEKKTRKRVKKDKEVKGSEEGIHKFFEIIRVDKANMVTVQAGLSSNSSTGEGSEKIEEEAKGEEEND